MNTLTENITLSRVGELARARPLLLHTAGRAAVDAWDALGNPLPVPCLDDMKRMLLGRSVVPLEAQIAQEPTKELPPIRRMAGNGSFA